MTDLLCMRLCVELSHVQRNLRQMQSRGQSLHRVLPDGSLFPGSTLRFATAETS